MWPDRVSDPGPDLRVRCSTDCATRPSHEIWFTTENNPASSLKLGSAISKGQFLAYGATGAHALVLF